MKKVYLITTIALVLLAVASATTEADTTPPAAPTGLAATAVSDVRIDLDWADNNEPDLASYSVYSSETTGAPYDLVASDVAESAYSHTGLMAETTYYYVVTAVDTSDNESSDSAEASATTAPFVGVGWWKLDENGGTTAYDSSGQGNDGTLGGDTQWVPGKYGSALAFDGAGDYVDLGNPSILDFGTGNFTLCAWVKDPCGNNVIAKGGDQSGGIRYALQVDTAVQLLVDDDIDKHSVSGGSGLQDGYWHHVAGVRDGDILRVYIDAVEVASGGLPYSPYDLSGTSQHNAYIGAVWQHEDDILGDFYTGSIDDVRVYNSALSHDEIADLAGTTPGEYIPPIEVIEVNEAVTYQTIDGFGASFTDSSAWLVYYALTTTERQAVMESLFDPVTGAGINYLRQPMGSSDFRVAYDYTYNDIPARQTDYDLVHFSIAHDEQYIIPILQQALAINPDLKIMGSPWSAPAWMKRCRTLISGNSQRNRLIDSDAIYNTYAEYFVRFIQAYAAHGITIDAVTFQNEPHYTPSNYPGMYMTEADQIRLAKAMGPKFDENGITTKIICWDHNCDEPDYPITVLNDTDARVYIDGSAFHGYAGDKSAMQQVKDAHPDKSLYFTECSSGDWCSLEFGDGVLGCADLIIDTTRYWAEVLDKWNIALDENNGPKIPGGCDTCWGTLLINQSTGEVTKRGEYYGFGQICRFVKSGSKRIEATGDSLYVSHGAFITPDTPNDLIVLVVRNKNYSVVDLNVVWKGTSFIYGLPARSVTTFRWPNTTNPAVSILITTGDKTKLLEEQPVIYFN